VTRRNAFSGNVAPLLAEPGRSLAVVGRQGDPRHDVAPRDPAPTSWHSTRRQ
jgi:hypothetical protein